MELHNCCKQADLGEDKPNKYHRGEDEKHSALMASHNTVDIESVRISKITCTDGPERCLPGSVSIAGGSKPCSIQVNRVKLSQQANNEKQSLYRQKLARHGLLTAPKFK